MHIQKITFARFNKYSLTNNIKREENIKNNEPNKYDRKAFAYRDYNIAFGERLNRTPENFYEQPFNKKGMTNAMKIYLYGDYEDRKHMPPIQMLQHVYDDLNQIDSLDYVRRLYSNEEPLFKDLCDKPNRKAKTGIIYEIEALKDEMNETPLFKDGTSNFGMYLLRKIYLEGKTLKEIQKDFNADLSTDYRGLITSDINYETMSAYGIKFPNNGFWKSFTATREDYPYVYKPRKADTSKERQERERTLSDIMNRHPEAYIPKKPKNKFKIKDDNEAKRIGDAILKGRGDKLLTEKSLRTKGIRDTEELNFVSKYLSQIMSVALEKTHASEEMRYFFENYDANNKKQKEKFDAYWHNNQIMRELQSLAISDTIKLFFEAYGEDGNNDEFRELLEYADSIKPAREEKIAEHNRIQAEYDAMFADIDTKQEEKSETAIPAITPDLIKDEKTYTKEEFDKMLEDEAIKNGAQVFEFRDENGNEFRIVCNLDEYITEEYTRLYKLMPQSFITKYINFIKKSPLATDEFRKSAALINHVPDFAQKELMPYEQCFKISEQLNASFNEKQAKAMLAAENALAIMLIIRLGGKHAELLSLNADELVKVANEQMKLTEWNEDEKQAIENIYEEFLNPPKDKDGINQINQAIVDSLTAINPDSEEWKEIKGLDEIDRLLVKNLRQYPALKNALRKDLRYTKFAENYNGTTKLLLLNNRINEKIKLTKAKLIIEDFIINNYDIIFEILAVDLDNILYYIKDPIIKEKLIQRYIDTKSKKSHKK